MKCKLLLDGAVKFSLLGSCSQPFSKAVRCPLGGFPGTQWVSPFVTGWAQSCVRLQDCAPGFCASGIIQLTVSLCFSSQERRYGGNPGLSVPAPDCRHHGPEMDPQPADERLRGGPGLREEVTGFKCARARREMFPWVSEFAKPISVFPEQNHHP